MTMTNSHPISTTSNFRSLLQLSFSFFFNDTATTEIYTLSLHDALPIYQNVQVQLEFENRSNNQLGMPLPRGVVRVFKADRNGAQQFVGEDRIDHTPRDESIRIQVGEAFDIVGTRRQMKYDTVGRCSSESDWEIELRNRKDEDVTINVIEPAGGDWDVVSSSHPSRRIDATSFAFDVDVPAREEVTVRYRVRVTWC